MLTQNKAENMPPTAREYIAGVGKPASPKSIVLRCFFCLDAFEFVCVIIRGAGEAEPGVERGEGQRDLVNVHLRKFGLCVFLGGLALLWAGRLGF